jgi:hypothetical protein
MKASSYVLCCVLLSLGMISNAPAQAILNSNQITSNGLDQSESVIAVSPMSSPLPESVQMTAWNDLSDGEYSRPGYGFTTDGGLNWNIGVVTPLRIAA